MWACRATFSFPASTVDFWIVSRYPLEQVKVWHKTHSLIQYKQLFCIFVLYMHIRFNKRTFKSPSQSVFYIFLGNFFLTIPGKLRWKIFDSALDFGILRRSWTALLILTLRCLSEGPFRWLHALSWIHSPHHRINWLEHNLSLLFLLLINHHEVWPQWAHLKSVSRKWEKEWSTDGYHRLSWNFRPSKRSSGGSEWAFGSSASFLLPRTWLPGQSVRQEETRGYLMVSTQLLVDC